MILFYAEKITPRVRYAARLLLKDILGLKIRYTTNKEEYLQSKIAKINYSKEPLQSGIFIQASNLLFETDIFEQEFKDDVYRDVPIFFLSGPLANLPFDCFAASFYLACRYEEYIPFIADDHNRFAAQESLQYKLNCLHLPLVNIYAEMLAEHVVQTNPKTQFNRRTYEFVNTVDVDNAAAYLGKGIFRVLGSYAQDLVSFNFSEILRRTQTLLKLKKDPFNTFEYVLGLQEKYGFKSIYFALFARLSQYDRSLTRYSGRLQRYLKSIADFCEIGIHPSYRSNSDVKLLEEELLSLERVIKKDVVKSRQHFLKLSFPFTYRNLLELEITDDYSMGYASESGFRAGLCTPYRFYDLEQEVETPLVVHSFPFMDGTYIYYKKKKPHEAWPEIKRYIKTIKQYHGEFIPVWHNRIFSEKEEEWKDWNALYEKMIEKAL
jgi:hypothetical protein